MQRTRSLSDSVRRAFEEIETMMKEDECEAISDSAIDRICKPIGDGKNGLPIASKHRLGCMIVGDGLHVRADGTVWSDGVVMEAMTNSEIENICK